MPQFNINDRHKIHQISRALLVEYQAMYKTFVFAANDRSTALRNKIISLVKNTREDRKIISSYVEFIESLDEEPRYFINDAKIYEILQNNRQIIHINQALKEGIESMA